MSELSEQSVAPREQQGQDPLRHLREQLTRAFIDLFGADIPYLGTGGSGSYGVHVENLATDASYLDLVLTFRSGVRYCCFEFACHFPFYDERSWSRLRGCMDRHGLGDFPLPVIRKVRGVIEKGAVVQPSPVGPVYIMEGSEYEAGPFEAGERKGSVKESGLID
jgi:hypothetical protein